jgi:hypothetical protein
MIESFTYPEYLNEVATIIGRMRNESNTELTSLFPEYSRGSQDERVHINGVLCEMIFAYYLQKESKQFKMGVLLGGKPLPEPDIIIGNTRIDVKWVSSDEFRVNTKAHRKKNDVTHYAFIRIAPPNYAKMWVIKYSEVDRWEEKTAFTPFLFKKIYEPTSSGKN